MKKKKIIDNQGYLINIENWNEQIAIKIANIESILLKNEHWSIIYFLHKFYLNYNIVSPTRIMIQEVLYTYNIKKKNSRYLFFLFPCGVSKQAAKIAGLPKKIICI